MSKAGVVRLLPDHRDKIIKIQEMEGEKSPLGVKPSMGAIANALIQRGLDDVFSDEDKNSSPDSKS